MPNFLDLAATRRSIRKFQDIDIPVEELEYFIQAAVNAPSGCNSQCWRFIAVRDKDIIKQMAEAVIQKTDSILEVNKAALNEDYLSSKRKMVSFFRYAPVVIAVFMTKARFYDNVMITALKAQGYDDDSIVKFYGSYDLLSVGAAIQNLLLAVHEKGYGACWMNEPVIVGEEINRILRVPQEQKFISLIPVGVPAYVPRSKEMKELAEVFSIK